MQEFTLGKRRRIKEKGLNIAKSLFPALKVITPIIAFISQLTLKDREDPALNFSGGTKMEQLQMLGNITLGRIFGIQPFGNKISGIKQTITFDNINNDWTKMGVYGIGYKLVGGLINKFAARSGLGGNLIPHTARIGSLAKGAFAGGLLGSIFDAPTNNMLSGGSTSSHNLSVGTPQLKVTNSYSTYHNGSDSTKSGFT